MCGALIDSSFQVSMLTQVFKKTWSSCLKISLLIYGLEQSCFENSSSVTCKIHPINRTDIPFTVDTVVLPKICSEIPSTFGSSQTFTNISYLPFADPHFNIPHSVDLLLGADIFPLILKDEQLTGNASEPCAINTIFGWVITGKIGNNSGGF